MDGVALIIPGISQGEADGRYVRRFVGSALAAETAEINGQPTLYNPNGPVMGGVPEDAQQTILATDVGGRFGTQIYLVRATSTGPAPTSVRQYRMRGTLQSPTAALSGDWLGAYAAGTFFDDTQAVGSCAEIVWIARENQASTNRGGEWVIRGAGVGAGTMSNLLFIRRSTVGADTEVQSGVTGLSFIPASYGRMRNPLNTATFLEWNATGLGFYGVAPIARPTITGSRAGNAAVASIAAQLAALGLVVDSTTA